MSGLLTAKKKSIKLSNLTLALLASFKAQTIE